ncbi:hypothetical protein C8R42DRAFT_676470 [Lentinula raphanica]|nr:hypothetical protein C8R42DRAFT_676470 [Lentinula raphanica]
MPEARFATLALPLDPGAVAVSGVPVHGLKTSMPFTKGGYRRPPMPITFACLDGEFAKFLYCKLQPYVANNFNKLGPQIFIDGFTNSREFKEVADAANKVSSLFWSVKFGKSVGVFFQTLEALSSVDEATTDFQQGFAFRTFNEAVRFHLGNNNRNPANRVYEYNPSQPDLAQQVRRKLGIARVPSPTPPTPPTPPSDSECATETESDLDFSSSSTSAASTPKTPCGVRRTQSASASSVNNDVAAASHSPHIFIQVNAQGTPSAARQPNPQFWSRSVLVALGFSDGKARKIGSRATTLSLDDFLLYCQCDQRIAEKVGRELAAVLWDMNNRGVQNL